MFNSQQTSEFHHRITVLQYSIMTKCCRYARVD